MAPFPATLTTDRLVATPVDLAAELDDYAALFADPAVAGPMWPAHLGGVRTREQSEQFVAHFDAHWKAHGFGPWTVRERDGGAFVGQVGLGHTIVAGRAEVEAGFILAHDRWGRGYATEGAVAVRDDAFERLRLARLVAFVRPRNAASINVMGKLGMTLAKDALCSHGMPMRIYAVDNPLG